MLRRLPALVALAALCACGDGNPLEPGQPQPSPGPSATPVAVTISGETTLARPGLTTQLTATVRLSDGTTRDVTSTAAWQGGWNGALRVCSVSGGRITSMAYGTGTVVATYEGLRAQVEFRVARAGMFALNGVVSEDGIYPLAQATVVLVPRSGAPISATTDSNGRYSMAGAGAVVLRGELNGYEAQEREIALERDTEVNLSLRRLASGDYRGAYRLTFTASPSCTLPPVVSTRRYVAQVEQRGNEVIVAVSGGDFVAWGGSIGFTGTRSGSTIQFRIRDTYDDGYNLIERVGGGDLFYSGAATATIANDRLGTVSFDGTLRYSGTGQSCRAADHTIAFER